MSLRWDMAARVASLSFALALGACGSGTGLTTGTLLGGGSASAPVAAPAETATDRALHVATTSARAQRCGYVFDPGSVRQGYLAFEAQQGGAPDQVAKAEKSYDYTLASISNTIAGKEDYCSDAQTAIIKRDLTQVLAGDYSAPRKKPEADVGWWTAPKSTAPMDRDKIFDPLRR